MSKNQITFFLLSLLFINSSFAKVEKECIILLHGLLKNKKDMFSVENKLRNRKNTVIINNSYPSTKFKIEKLSFIAIEKSLKDCQKKIKQEKFKVHFVTHSMGGILLRYYLKNNSPRNLGRVVMLAPPNKGSEIIDHQRDNSLVSYFIGPAGLQLSTNPESLPNTIGPAHFDLGIIAGISSRKLYPFSKFLPKPNDGNVSLNSTKLEGMKEHLILNYNHRTILHNNEVLDRILHYLDHGFF